MKLKTLITAVAILFLASTGASAQRTAEGAFFLDLNGSYVPVNGFGGNLGFGRYTMIGFWETRANALFMNYFIDAEAAKCNHYMVQGGYLFRLAASRSRVLNLYGGGGAFIGAATFNTTDAGWSKLSQLAKKDWYSQQTSFLYGAYAKVDFEVFFTDTLAFDLAVKAPFGFYPKNEFEALQKITGFVRCEVSAGLRINF